MPGMRSLPLPEVVRLHDRPTHGKYAEWLLAYAAEKKNNTNEMQQKELDKMTPEERKRLFDRVKDAAQTLLDALKPRTDVVGMMFVPQEVFDAFFGEGAHLKNDILNKRHLFGFEVHQSYGRGNRIELSCWCHDKYCMVRDEDGNEITYRKVLFPAKEAAMQIDVDKVIGSCPE